MKTGFILHLDSLSVLDELTNEQAGILFKALRDYNQGKEPELDFAMKMAFLPFKNQFQRDLINYEKTCERNKLNGSKGGRPKKPKETEETHSVLEKPKKPDNDNKNNNDNNNIYRSFAHLSLSEEEFEKLNKVFSQEEIDNILDSIENNTNNKKYKSLYLTARNWLNRNKPKEEIIPFEKLDRLTRDSILKGYLKHEHYLQYYGKHKY